MVQAIKGVRVAAKKSLKGLNVLAGQKMAKGDYGAAEALAAKGKEIQQSPDEVDALRKRWREVCGSETSAGKKPRTPLWAYYQPILQALAQAGGSAKRADLERQLERVMESSFQAGDLAAHSSGRARWILMVQLARKPMISEGWIEAKNGRFWKITDAGRKAAEKAGGAGRK